MWRRNQRAPFKRRTGAWLYSLLAIIFQLLSCLFFSYLNFILSTSQSDCIFVLFCCLGTNNSEGLQHEQRETTEKPGNSRRGEHCFTGEQQSGQILYTKERVSYMNLYLSYSSYVLCIIILDLCPCVFITVEAGGGGMGRKSKRAGGGDAEVWGRPQCNVAGCGHQGWSYNGVVASYERRSYQENSKVQVPPHACC